MRCGAVRGRCGGGAGAVSRWVGCALLRVTVELLQQRAAAAESHVARRPALVLHRLQDDLERLVRHTVALDDADAGVGVGVGVGVGLGLGLGFEFEFELGLGLGLGLGSGFGSANLDDADVGRQ